MHITYAENIKLPDAATIIIQIHKNKRKNNPIHTIINIYRRPHQNIHNFLINLQSAIDDIRTISPNTSITIHGDININILEPTREMTDLMIENNLLTTITPPTRYDEYHNTATLIDVTLTTLTSIQTTAGTISPPLTDHLPIYTIFHNTIPRREIHAQKRLSLNRCIRDKDTILPHIKAALTHMPHDEHAT